MKILILAANPHKDLNLDREIRDLRGVIQQSRKQEEFEVIDALAVRVQDLQELFLRHKPQIVHFCGHGNGEKGLVFENDKGGEQVDTAALTELLRLSCNAQPIECVVLNACYSESQAEEFSEYIDYVIGMRQEIKDEAAIAFSIGFYRALGYGRPIQECYDYGCNAIQFIQSGLNVTEVRRKLGIVDTSDSAIIFEYLKPILKITPTLLSPDSPPKPLNTQKSKIEGEINQVLEESKLARNQNATEPEPSLINKLESRGRSVAEDSEEIPDFLNHLLENYFNKSSLKWSLCFTGEDESSKLGELIGELKNSFSATGNGKQVPSGFSYWGIISTLAWKTTCSDPLYPVMSDGTSSFNTRWKDICNEEFTKQKYHYVSLGVGIGDKDNEILKRLYSSNNSIRYFPVDMSSTMLRLGVRNATKDILLKGSHVLPIQIDFSVESNIIELRKLLDRVDNGNPILFSLLGNTLANFPDDIGLLQTISKLMQTGDKLLLEVATTEELNEEAAAAAAKEYANASSFKKFVTSTLLQYTNMNINFVNVCFEGSIEPSNFEDSIDSFNKALFIKVLYRNSSEETISIMLPDWETVEFREGDTIRLLTTRKYSANGLDKIISESKLKKITNSRSLLGSRNNRYGFGINLIVLTK
jgi:L-histidine N-alpha-methyltransferase